MQALVGDRTAADINLVAQMLILAGLLVGFGLARARRFDQHGNVQTAMVLLNLVLIVFVMVPSFVDYVIAGGTVTGRVAQLMTIHGLLGLVAAVAGLYLILRMRTGLIPAPLRVRDVKSVMRGTLALWTALVLLGVGIYYERYLRDGAAAAAPLRELRQLGADLYVHAVELEDAVARDSLPAAHRHAEHLVNLIEGAGGLHYGDNDVDGRLEDPGDGVGLLARLDAVAGASGDPTAATEAGLVRRQLDDIVRRSIDVLGASSIGEARAPAAEIVELARQANGDGVYRVDRLARAAGLVEAPPPVVVTPGAGGVAGVTVREDNFLFVPDVLTIPAGTTVFWINDEEAKHTVTADDGGFDSGDQAFGERYAYTFTEPGTYPYYCRYHGDVEGVGMAGTIVVE